MPIEEITELWKRYESIFVVVSSDAELVELVKFFGQLDNPLSRNQFSIDSDPLTQSV